MLCFRCGRHRKSAETVKGLFLVGRRRRSAETVRVGYFGWTVPQIRGNRQGLGMLLGISVTVFESVYSEKLSVLLSTLPCRGTNQARRTLSDDSRAFPHLGGGGDGGGGQNFIGVLSFRDPAMESACELPRLPLCHRPPPMFSVNHSIDGACAAVNGTANATVRHLSVPGREMSAHSVNVVGLPLEKTLRCQRDGVALGFSR